MRVALYFNPKAGTQIWEADDLCEQLRALGKEVRSFVRGRHKLRDATAWEPDLLVVAGGDGTVAQVVRKLWKRGSSIPVAILPIGTSNNIAWTLGLTAPIHELTRGLGTPREARLDVGLAEVGGEQTPFVEAAGAGFFGDVIQRAKGTRERLRGATRRLIGQRTTGEAQVRAAAAAIARQLRDAPARDYRIVADGVELSGRYVAVEAMNIAAIGPRAALAPTADTGDGAFDLTLIREEDREPLARIIESPGAREAELLRRRVQALELEWSETSGHLDDEVWPATGRGESPCHRARVWVGGSVRVLLPQYVQEDDFTT